jgi:regulator of cell morphogenesis and NO signaling
MIATHEVTVGDLAARQPRSIRVLHQHGIDFCDGGARSLTHACQGAGISIGQLLHEVAALEPVPAESDWSQATLEGIIDHVIQHHHVPLPEELERLHLLAAQVLHCHGAGDPERLAAIPATLDRLAAALLPHLEHEERVVFPMLCAGGAGAAEALTLLHGDHQFVRDQIAGLRALTLDYQPPHDASVRWRALYAGLAELEIDLLEHFHLEQHVLPDKLGREPAR